MLYNRVAAGESFKFKDVPDWAEECVTILSNGQRKNFAASCTKISKVLSKALNGNFTVRADKQDWTVNAYIVPPMISEKHPLINFFNETPFSDRDGLQILHKTNHALGGIDLSTGRLSGVCSEVPIIIVLTSGLLKLSALSHRQATAILLHEVGHALGYLLGMTQLVRSTAVMRSAHEVILGNQPRSKKIEFVKAVTKDNPRKMGADEIVAMAEISDARVLDSVFAINTQEAFRSKYGSDLYDLSLFENVADNFAAVCGFSGDLATGLVAVHKASMSKETMSTPLFILLELITAMLVLSTNVFGMLLFLLSARYRTMVGATYQSLGNRVDQLRKEVNLQLANKNLDPAIRRRLLADLDSISEAEKKVKREGGLLETLTKYIGSTPNERNRVKRVKQLEALVANDLYESSNRLIALGEK